MLTHVEFFPKDAIHGISHKTRMSAVMVSILSSVDGEFPRPNLANFVSNLSLDFVDCYEDVLNIPIGGWGNQLENLPGRFKGSSAGFNEHGPTLTHARQIQRFLATHQEHPEQLVVMAHCFGGISRSAAVAEYASSRYHIPVAGNYTDLSRANPRLLYLLWQAEAESHSKK